MATGTFRRAVVDGRPSGWVWVLLAFAVAYALLLIVETPTIDTSIVSGVAFAVAHAVVAAALMYVAPRSRLIQLAAIGFTVPLVVRAVGVLITSELVRLLGTPSNSYLAFAQSVREAISAFSDVAFVFELVAILAVAAYIGRIGTRGGWLIVVVAALLAAGQAFVVASTSPSAEFFPAHSVALWIVASVTLVAWGYLLAVVIEKRRLLLSVAAGIALINPALTLLTITIFPDALTAGPTNPIGSIYSATTWGLTAVYWLTLIGGVLLELRRQADADEDTDRSLQPRPAGSASS